MTDQQERGDQEFRRKLAAGMRRRRQAPYLITAAVLFVWMVASCWRQP